MTYTFWFLQLMHTVLILFAVFVVCIGIPTNEPKAESETQPKRKEENTRSNLNSYIKRCFSLIKLLSFISY